MRDSIDLYEQVEVLESMIEAIHRERLSHRILSMFATRTDSVRLARAAFDALEAQGFVILRKEP